ncbi:MAG TPA: ATP-binding protein [Candidatus Marinimicrobia bacterium]|nr:ATP-binding protein [Candidatus Neomarinimicrobiota bacterium]HRU92715.1 ATP-binding protein [Candidatus Neomarinimicrobiota bacterium]
MKSPNSEIYRNPFKFGTVVDEPYFFDRKKELKKVVETIKSGNNLVLYAPRRYGKTSLIMKAIQELENDGYQCIYFDFMTIYSRESFVEAFSKAILAKQSQWKKALQTFSTFIKGLKPLISFDEKGNPQFSIEFIEPKVSDITLKTVINLPEKLADSYHKTVIIMDEFQDIHKLNGEDFEDLLRSQIQHHKQVNYLFMGSRTHLLQDMFTNKNRPFYNSAMTMSMGPLPYQETIDFLINGFGNSGIALDEPRAVYLIDKAGNIPYYIQFLAYEIWQDTVPISPVCQQAEKVITTEIIERNADKILELKQDYYFELFDHCTAYQKKLLKALAKTGLNIFSKEYANTFHLSAPSTTQKAISSLINSGIIEKKENEYSFCDPFFKWYILRLPA